MLSKDTLTNSDDEIRKLILSVDTTYKLANRTMEQFLPPNFYVERLVTAISKKIVEAKQTERSLVLAEVARLYQKNVSRSDAETKQFVMLLKSLVRSNDNE